MIDTKDAIQDGSVFMTDPTRHAPFFTTYPNTSCPSCLYFPLIASSDYISSLIPKLGDIAVCVHCYATLTYTNHCSTSLRALTPAEIYALPAEEQDDLRKLLGSILAFKLLHPHI